MFEQGWKRSAVLAALHLATLAAVALAADAPAPAVIRPAAGGPTAMPPVVSTPTLVSVMRPATLASGPEIRSVMPGFRDERVRLARVTSGRAAAAAPAAPVSPIAWAGQLRCRFESRLQLDYRLPGTFGRAATQSLADRGSGLGLRNQVGATLRISPGVRGGITLQDARMVGAGGSPSGTLANPALYKAWLDLDSLGGRPLHLRVGRQRLAYGDGRVLGESDWSQAGCGDDGARLRWGPGNAQVDGFMAWIHEGRITGRHRVLSGIDARWRGNKGFEAEAYHFRRSSGDAGWTSETGAPGGLRDATSGLRTRVLRGPFEGRLEGALQRGRRAGDPVSAGFRAGRITADLKSAWKTRVFLERSLSSGDANPSDGHFQRFEPVDWAGHDLQGTLDIAGESNMGDWCAGLTAQPVNAWTVQSEYHLFSLSRPRDAWVDDAGNTLRRDVTGAAGNSVGREFDATVRWATRARLSVVAGGSRFWRGEFVRKTGGGADVSWGFVQLDASF